MLLKLIRSVLAWLLRAVDDAMNHKQEVEVAKQEHQTHEDQKNDVVNHEQSVEQAVDETKPDSVGSGGGLNFDDFNGVRK